MNYSEYAWLCENVGGWGVLDINELDIEEDWDEEEDWEAAEFEQKQLIEEDCMDTFFLNECNGKCHTCNLRKKYMDS